MRPTEKFEIAEPWFGQTAPSGLPDPVSMRLEQTEHDVASEGMFWDRDLNLFDDALIDQTHYLGANNWDETRLVKHRSWHEGKLIGMAQVFAFAMGEGPGLAYVKYGPAWRRKGETANLVNYIRTVEDLIVRFAEQRKLCLTIAPPADPIHNEPMIEALHALGFRYRRELPEPVHYMVDLAPSEEEQLANLSQKWRYNLRKAQKSGLTARRAEGPEAVSQFLALYGELKQRKGFRDSNWIGDFAEIYRAMPLCSRPDIVLAYHQDVPVAGAVICRVGDTAAYHFGASSDQALKLRAGYALHWWIMRWLSETGEVRWYDLDGVSQNPGLTQFKSGMIGKCGHAWQMPGEFDYCISAGSRAVATGIQLLRNARSRLKH
ncbi:MAG: peptidoglycan bridge formation glycyltransferase FemA/FemB family protein [Pseudomonadota bacterium]